MPCGTPLGETITFTATNITDGIVLTQTVSVTFNSVPWYNNAWSYRKAILVSHTNVAANLTNFPVLISRTDNYLRSHALTNGYDILFTSADGTNKLAHEIEKYTSSNGTLVSWVKVPFLSSTTDTILYLYYGNASTTNQQDATNVWDSSFRAVWHCRESSGTSLADATVNTNRGTFAGSPSAPTWSSGGQIGNALAFDGVDDYLTIPHSTSLNISGKAITISGWYRITNTVSDQVIFGKFYNADMSSPYYQYGMEFESSTREVVFFFGSSGSLKGPWGVTPTLSTWQYIAFTYDGTNVNGYLNSNAPIATAETSSITARSQELRIGEDNNSAQPYLGCIDELRVSSIVRSAGWLATEYANQSSPATFSIAGSQEISPMPRLAITAVNGGSSPTAGTAFSVVVQAQTETGTPRNVTNDTAVILSLHSGYGTLGGTLTGIITAGISSVTISGVTYTKAESGVVLTATRTSGDSLIAGDSSPFSVNPGAVSAAQSTVSANPTSVEANGFNTATITVTLKDAYTNLVSGKTVTLAKGSGSSTISAASGPSDVSGVVTFTVSDTVAETTTYTATDSTDGIAITQTASVTFSKSLWSNGSWPYRKAVVIHHTNVVSDLTNFPVLVSLTDSDLAARAQTNGYDLRFTAADGVTRLAHEIETYTSSNGTLVAWVNVPSLSSTTDTTLFLYYGNPSAANQQNVGGVWGSDFKAVWHLSNSNFGDSTTNANTGNNSGTTNTTGKIGDGRSFDGVNDYVYTTTRYTDPQHFTLEAWFKTAFASGKNILAYENNRTGTGSTRWDRQIYVGTDGKVHFECWSGVADDAMSPNTYTDDAWHHVVAVRDDTNDILYLYVDGQEVATAFSPNAEVVNSYWRIGSYQSGDYFGSAGYFPGSIDEVRIAFTARSAAWVRTAYNNQNSPATFLSASSQEELSMPKLAVTSVNGGSSVTAGTPFSVTVEAQTSGGTPQNVTNGTAVSLSLAAGSGALTGTITGTITAGASSVTISGVTYAKAESGVILTATRTSGDNLTAGDSLPFTVNPGVFAKLQLLMPGETAAPGTPTGKTGSPTARTAGTAFDVTVNAVDANWNLISTNDTIAITSSDSYASLPANAALSGGTQTFSVTLKTAGSATVTATDITDGTKTANTSPVITVNAGAFTKLQLLMPGETAVPGSPTGKSGSPSAQIAGNAFTVTVRAVDANWNLRSSTHTVGITSSDTNATLPANAALGRRHQDLQCDASRRRAARRSRPPTSRTGPRRPTPVPRRQSTRGHLPSCNC